MIGLIVLTVGGALVLAYLWLLFVTARYVKRNTNSALKAALAVLGIVVLTFGDTVFNRWYHKAVLCKRDDVGVKIFEKVQLPVEYWDEVNNRPKLPLSISSNVPFLGRYVEARSVEPGGWHPLTAYWRHEVVVKDLATGTRLSRFVDYNPRGGFWWLFPLRIVNPESAMGWFIHIPRGGKSCYPESTDPVVDARYGAFKKSNPGEQR